MAELATPSAATMNTADPEIAKAGKTPAVKPVKPDEEKFKEEEAKAEKELKIAQEKLNKAQEKLNNRPNNKDSPTAKRLQEIRNEQEEIKQKQAGNKSSFVAVQERKKKLEEHLKARITELNAARGKLNFKSVDEIDREIARLNKQVESGTLKIVDEKKNLSEVSNLTKLRKNFSGFEQQQKGIDELKAQIAEESKALNDPERKSLNDRYQALKAESDKLYTESRAAQKDQNSLYDEKNKAKAVQQEKYAALKQIRDTYHSGLREFKAYDREARKQRQEKYKAEREAEFVQRRKATAAQKLEEASAPAYQGLIHTAESLIRYFDPSQLPAKVESVASQFAASAQRTIDDTGFKGMKIAKKDDEDYFQGTGGKKGKKGRKAADSPATPAGAKLNLSYGIIDQLNQVGVDTPSSDADKVATVTKLKEKLEHWRSDQKRQTDENIAKAQKEIDRLEAESTANGTHDSATKPSQANQGVNGKVSAEAELKQEQDAAADVAEELEKTKIEDAPETS